jgi:hypothetical protein
MTEIIIGIDPGVKGAVAVQYDNDLLLTHDLKVCYKPTGSFNSLDPALFDGLVTNAIPDECDPENVAVFCEEAQHLAHRTSIKTARAIYDARGVMRSVLERRGFKVRYVHPQTWKTKLGLRKQDKKASIAKACLLFPKSKTLFTKMYQGRTLLLDGRAEAALIAYYGSLLLEKEATR